MKICKIEENEAKLMLNTLDQIQIAPGLDNADMYVGLGMMIRQAINAAEEVEDGESNS